MWDGRDDLRVGGAIRVGFVQGNSSGTSDRCFLFPPTK